MEYKLTKVLLASLALLLGVCGACLRRPGQESTEITYNLPTAMTVALGDSLPGTDICYQGMTEEGVRVTIGGQEALKRKGDSLDWKGELAPDIQADLDLRVVWFTEQEMHVAGTVKVEIEGIEPQATPIDTDAYPIEYTGPVAYGLAKDAKVPGSLITYEEHTEEGAKLGGTGGYPYRQTGDSVFWEGKLRDDVLIKLDLRVVQYDERGLRLAGLVHVWIKPQ